MSSTGLTLPSSWGADGSDWSYPSEIVNINSSSPTQAQGTVDTGDEILVSLSWDGGTTYTSTKSTEALGFNDDITLGGSTDTWGRTWQSSDFSNMNFRVQLESTYPEYHEFYDFSFSIPAGSVINGVVVELLECGSDFGTVWVRDTLKVNVYYTSTPIVGTKYPLPAFRSL